MERIIKALVARGWFKLAAHISPTLAVHYLSEQLEEAEK